jgi:hypothetical protein
VTFAPRWKPRKTKLPKPDQPKIPKSRPKFENVSLDSGDLFNPEMMETVTLSWNYRMHFVTDHETADNE